MKIQRKKGGFSRQMDFCNRLANSLFFKCLMISGAIHAVALTLFFTKPLHFHPNFFSQLGKTPPTLLDADDIALIKKEAILEESFRDFAVLSPQSSLQAIPRPLEYSIASVEETPLHLNPLSLPDTTTTSIASLPAPPLDITSDISVKLIKPTLLSQIPIIEETPINPFIDIAFQPLPPSPPEGFIDLEFRARVEKFQIPLSAFSFPQTTSPQTPSSLPTHLLADQEPTLPGHAPSPSLQLPSTPRIAFTPLTSSLNTYNIPAFNTFDWNAAFDLEIKTTPLEVGGHLYSITLIPKIDLAEYRLKQNFYFLIDRSNSIEKHRYQTFKRAVLRAIASLREDDNFNIVIFDSKIVRLHEKPLPFNKKNQKLAEEFLEKQPHGHYGAATDIYSSLDKVLPTDVAEEEAHTAILISDGDSKLKPEKQRAHINTWLAVNKNKITLYTAAVGQGNNLSTLDLLATVSRGSLIYSETHTGFPRKLAKLILTLRSPIAKDLTLTAPSPLYPNLLSNLLSDHPLTFYGTTDTLTDFTFQIEGTNKSDLFSIKKNITFTKAKPGNRLLVKQWNTQKAHLCYQQYLLEGKLELLREAQALLSDEPAYSRR